MSIEPPADPLRSDRNIHSWFELSYAQYLTIPRSVLQSMPDEWQRRFVQCLEELDETIDWRPTGRHQYRVQLREVVEKFSRAEGMFVERWGKEVEDPLMDYRRGRRHVPHRAEITRPASWPHCPSCEADELSTLAPHHQLVAAALVGTPLTPYLSHGVHCQACGYEGERPLKVIADTPNSWLVRVGKELQCTQHGQLYAIRSIPQDHRRRISSYQFDGEVIAGAYRWWRFLVTYQEGAS